MRAQADGHGGGEGSCSHWLWHKLGARSGGLVLQTYDGSHEEPSGGVVLQTYDNKPSFLEIWSLQNVHHHLMFFRRRLRGNLNAILVQASQASRVGGSIPLGCKRVIPSLISVFLAALWKSA